MADNPSANREFKDTVFKLLLGEPEAGISVCNAILNTNYGTDTEIKIAPLKKIFSNRKTNDLSFLIDNRLIVLLEHQSTIDENMPLRMLDFIRESYKEYTNPDILYTVSKVTLPRPEFFVLYNGVEKMDDTQILKLSDLFADSATGASPSLELIVKVYNINTGRNLDMVRRSEALYAYTIFVGKVREYYKPHHNISLEDAIKQAIIYCIENNFMKKTFNNHKKEIINMFTQEWDLDTAIAVREKDAEKRKALKIAKNLRVEGMDVDTVARVTGLTIDDILRLK